MMCATATEDAMVEFVKANAAVISKYRVTTPVAVLKRIIHLLGENAEHALGTAPNYLGGDAQVATQVVLHDVGAALIFRDPIGASGAAADCEALLRLINVHNIMNATNPSTADMLVHVLDEAMDAEKTKAPWEMVPSFYYDLESPSVAAYKAKQNAVIASCSSGGATSAPSAPVKVTPAATAVSDAIPAHIPMPTRATVKDLLGTSTKLQFFASRGTRPQGASGRNSIREEAIVEGTGGAGGWDTMGWDTFDFDREYDSMRSPNKRSDFYAGGLAEGSSVRGSLKRLQLSPTKKHKLNMHKLKMAATVFKAFPSDMARVERHMEQARQMRCLALISHNNMKGAMKAFVIRHQAILKRFRLTGTNSTMTMLKAVLGEKEVVYGPTCSSGPLGGDAEVGALMCVADLGGMIFFTDPLDPHPHAADIVALIRMADLHNIMHASNPTTGDALVRVLQAGLDDKEKGPQKIPTFFTTNMSPAIEWHNQNFGGATYKPSGPLSCFFDSAMKGPLSCFFPK